MALQVLGEGCQWASCVVVVGQEGDHLWASYGGVGHQGRVQEEEDQLEDHYACHQVNH